VTAWRLSLRLLRRDWRSGELYLLAAALALTVAAMTAVAFFGDRVERAMQRQGGELIAADLAVDDGHPIPPAFAYKVRDLGLASTTTLEFPSVVRAGEATQLVQVKAAGTGYPLRGQLRVQADSGVPDEEAAGGPSPGEVWAEARLLPLLGLETLAGQGAEIALGETRLRLTKILAYEPDRGANLVQLAPRLLVNAADIPATGLVTPASRVRYRLLVAGDAAKVTDFRAWAQQGRLPPTAQLLDPEHARPELAAAIAGASRFLRLATLVTLLVAGAAIALASRRLVERQTDAVAVMRCLGAPQHLLTRVFVLRLLAFGIAVSLVGALLGYAAQQGLVALAGDLFAQDLPPPSAAPIAVGLVTGLVALLGFALPPLVQLARVTPLRALRRDLGTPRASVLGASLAAAAALALLIWWQAGDAQLALRLLAGLGGTLLGLTGAVVVLVRLAAWFQPRTRGVWRLGLAGLTRRPAGAVLQVAGFGVGVLALLLLAVVRVDLLQAWQEGLPPDAPNRFLINIQPQDVAPLRDFLTAQGLADSGVLPMVRGRLTRIGDRAVDPDAYPDPRAQRLAAREFNLSYAEHPQSDNQVVAGRWWAPADPEDQFSVEEGLAKTLGVRLGDRLTFWVSGHEVSAQVTSLRRVRWDSFNVNFFVVSPPGLLGAEAASYVTSFHLPPGRAAVMADLQRRLPAVTPLDVDALLGQVRQVMDRGASAVEYVFLFTLAAGLLVMLAGIQATLAQRRGEHAVLRALGASRRTLLAALAVEFTVTGLLAGLLGSAFAELTAWLLAGQVFDLEFAFNPKLWILGVLGSAGLIGLAGTLATYPLLVRPPLEGLRRG
jgi:putative ABC transport system permease protein